MGTVNSWAWADGETLSKEGGPVVSPRESLPALLTKKATALSKGSECEVYGIERHPDLLCKRYRAMVRDVLDPSSDGTIERMWNEQEDRERRLRETLARTIGTREARRTVVHEKLWPIRDEDGDVEEYVTFQRYVPQAVMENRLLLRGGYAELWHTSASDAQYQRVNEALVQGTAPFEEKEFLDIQDSNELYDLVRRAKTSDRLRSHLVSLVRGVIAYSNEYEDILDTGGKNNMFLYEQEDGEYAARFIDALMLDGGDMWRRAQEGFLALHRGESIDGKAASGILNAINYVRTVNGIAASLGMPDRINILPSELEGRIDFNRIREEVMDVILAPAEASPEAVPRD